MAQLLQFEIPGGTVDWLQQNGLLAETRHCPKCSSMMKLRNKSSAKQYETQVLYYMIVFIGPWSRDLATERGHEIPLLFWRSTAVFCNF